MIDYTYVECSSSVLQGLRMFTEKYPDYRADEIQWVWYHSDFHLATARPISWQLISLDNFELATVKLN